jgi:hypothetical protein
MRGYIKVACTILSLLFVVTPLVCLGGDSVPRPCLPDRPIPPETVGPMSLPFDIPVWPTILKTEFHVLPWVSLGKASVCLPYCSWAIEIPAPNFSLKPIPLWIPWLRPLDVEGKDSECFRWPLN